MITFFLFCWVWRVGIRTTHYTQIQDIRLVFFDSGTGTYPDCFYINGIEAPLITLAVGKTYRFDTSTLNSDFKLYQRGLTGSYAIFKAEDSTGDFLEIIVDENTRDHLIYDTGGDTTTPDMGSSIDVIGSNTY